MKDITLWDRMTNLKRLNICENMEFFMNKEIKAAYDKQLLQGIDAQTQSQVSFMDFAYQLDDLLYKLNYVQELTCDPELELLIMNQRPTKNYLPNLRIINGVQV